MAIEAYLFLDYQDGWSGSPDRVAQLRAQAEQYDAHNAVVFEEYRQLYAAFRAAAEKIERKSEMRRTSRQRYSRMQPTPRWDSIVCSEPRHPLSNVFQLKSKLDEAERDRARAKKAEEETARKRQAEIAASAKASRAAAYLLQAGWKIEGDDWVDPGAGNKCGSNSVAIATEIARSRAIEARAKEIAGTFIEFAGDDTCEGCMGWDGESRRCSCGNRRVSWECDGDFESMHVWAQAY